MSNVWMLICGSICIAIGLQFIFSHNPQYPLGMTLGLYSVIIGFIAISVSIILDYKNNSKGIKK